MPRSPHGSQRTAPHEMHPARNLPVARPPACGAGSAARSPARTGCRLARRVQPGSASPHAPQPAGDGVFCQVKASKRDCPPEPCAQVRILPGALQRRPKANKSRSRSRLRRNPVTCGFAARINSVRPSGPQDDLPASAAQIRAGKDNFPSGPCDHALQPPHLLRTGTASQLKTEHISELPQAFAPVAAVRTHAQPPLCAPASVYGIPPTPDRTGRAVAPAGRSWFGRGPRIAAMLPLQLSTEEFRRLADRVSDAATDFLAALESSPYSRQPRGRPRLRCLSGQRQRRAWAWRPSTGSRRSPSMPGRATDACSPTWSARGSRLARSVTCTPRCSTRTSPPGGRRRPRWRSSAPWSAGLPRRLAVAVLRAA